MKGLTAFQRSLRKIVRRGFEMQATLKLDTLTPDLERRIGALRHAAPVFGAMAVQLQAMTLRAFSNPSARPADWPARKLDKEQGGPQKRDERGKFVKNKDWWPPLRHTGELYQGIQVVEVTDDHAIVAANVDYASFQQYGTAKIPPRPFFPVLNGVFTPAAIRKIDAVAKDKLRQMGVAPR